MSSRKNPLPSRFEDERESAYFRRISEAPTTTPSQPVQETVEVEGSDGSELSYRETVEAVSEEEEAPMEKGKGKEKVPVVPVVPSNDALPAMIQKLQMNFEDEREARVESQRENNELRREVASLRRQETPTPAREQSTAFGRSPFNTNLRTGYADHEEFDPYGGNGRNPQYERRCKNKSVDPKEFSGGSKDGPDFHSWVVQIREKLQVSPELWMDERDRTFYVISRLSGMAYKSVAGRIGRDNPFRTTAELIQVLESTFRNPNEKAEASEALRKLEYRQGEDWQEFVATFNHLFSLSNGNPDAIKAELLLHCDNELRLLLGPPLQFPCPRLA